MLLRTCSAVYQHALCWYTLNSITRNRILGTNCTENAVSCVGFRGVPGGYVCTAPTEHLPPRPQGAVPV
eukprot:3669599-Rhodomonas_salina.1